MSALSVYHGGGADAPKLEREVALAMRAVTHLAVVLSFLWMAAPMSAQQPTSEAFTHIKRGIQARKEHRLDEAVREFQAAMRLGANVAQVHAELGLAQHQQGNLAAAVQSFRKALEINPNLKGVFSLLGYDLLMIGQAADALTYLKTASQEAPEDLKLKSWLGLAYLQSGDSRRAIETLEAVRISSPQDVNVLLYLAEAHQTVLDELLEEAFRLDPERAKEVFDPGAKPADSGPHSSAPTSTGVQPREHLIRQDCTQCHKWTPPGILPKEAWLGKTAKMFGLANDGLLASEGRPIRQVELEEVVAYFQKLAPAKLDTPAGEFSQDSSARLVARNLSGVPPGDRLPGTSNVRLLDLFADLDGPVIVACDMISGWGSRGLIHGRLIRGSKGSRGCPTPITRQPRTLTKMAGWTCLWQISVQSCRRTRQKGQSYGCGRPRTGSSKLTA